MTTYLPNECRLLILAVFLFCFSSASLATTDYVDADWNELNNAVTTGSADTIRFNFSGSVLFSGTITIGRDLVLMSDAPRNVVFEGAGGIFRAFDVAPGAGGSVSIIGVTMQDFSDGGIKYTSGTLDVVNCVFDGNLGTQYGGAIEWAGPGQFLTVKGCSFYSNSAGDQGGAIYTQQEVEIINCTFYQNQANSFNGGAVYIFAGGGTPAKLAFNSFIENQAMAGSGGALYSDTEADLYNNLFYNNSAGGTQDAFFNLGITSRGYNAFEAAGNTNMGLAGTDVVGGFTGDLRPTPVFDGYGNRYVPIVNESSPLVDQGTNFLTPPFNDQRRAFREMDGAPFGGAPLADIGAIEFTKYTVDNNDGGTAIAGSLGWCINDIVSGPDVMPPYFIEFDLAPGFRTINAAISWPNINQPLIIDGFSQHDSKVPGYKSTVTGDIIKHGICGVELDNVLGFATGFSIVIGGDNTQIKGVSIMGYPAGISISNANNIRITGCHIGMSHDGLVANGNATGIDVNVAQGLRIGGPKVIERNLISANLSGGGVALNDVQNSFVENNLIGTTRDGMSDQPNKDGIYISGNSNNIVIGGKIRNRTSTLSVPYFIAGNTISGNYGGALGTAIVLDGPNVTNNKIFGNYLGPDFSGEMMISSNLYGIRIVNNAINNQIGGVAEPLARNIISANQIHGIHFTNTGGDNFVENNWIGINAAGNASVPNQFGIFIDNNGTGYNMTIGGPAPGTRNVISGNSIMGIVLNGAAGQSNTARLKFEGNYVGLSPDGNNIIANADGIGLSSTSFITVGGSCAGCGNYISGNTGFGIGEDGTTNDIIIYQNTVGLTPSGIPAPNLNGLDLTGTAGQFTIGGTNPGEGNEIAQNTEDGIKITGSVTAADISGNSIHNNGQLGVDINNDGVTANDVGDADLGPNGVQNFPQIINAFECAGSGFTEIEYLADFEVGFTYAVQFYIADSDNQEGETYLGEHIVTVTAPSQIFTYVHGGVIVPGTLIVSNASQINGTNYSTSEFSPAFAVSSPSITVTATNPSICGTQDGQLQLIVSPPLLPSTNYNVTYDDDGTTIGPNPFTTDAAGDIYITALDSGTYTNIIVDIMACIVNEGGIHVLSYPAVPGPVMTGPSVVCEDSTETYSATGNGGTFTWTISGGTVSPSTGTPVNATWGPPSASFIQVTETIGSCTAIDQIPVTINSTDDPSFTVSSSSECQSGTDIISTITGLGGGTFSALPAGLSLNAVTGDIDVSASTPNTYTLVYTTSGPCPTSSSLAITILADEDPSFSYSSTNECESGTDMTATVTGTGGGTFTAAPAGLSINSTTGLIDVSLSAPGSYTVNYTTPGVCSMNSNVGVTVMPDEDPTYTYSSTSECVSGTDITASVTGTGGGTFTAAPAGLNLNSATGFIDVSASTPGSYTVTYTTPGVCSMNSNLGVTILADEDPSFSYPGSTYCQDAANPTPTITGTGGGTFTSVPAGMIINSASGVINISGSAPGTYTVTYTTPGVCSMNANEAITISPLPTFTVTTNDPTTCGGSDGTMVISGLNASTSYNISYIDGGAVGPLTLTSDAGGNITIAGLDAGSITDVNVDLLGCSTLDPGTYVLSDPAPPIVDPGAATNVCLGNSVAMGGAPTATGGSGAYDYVWDNGADSVANPVVSPTATTTYQVIVTDVMTTCADTAQTTVTVLSLPAPSITGPSVVCEGATASYSVSAFPSYVWSMSSVNASTITGSFSSTETYNAGTNTGVDDSLFVSVTDANGCTGKDTLLITIQNDLGYLVGGTDPTTCGGADGTLVFTGGGLTPSTSYDVTYNDGISTIGPNTIVSNTFGDIVVNGLTAGTYSNFIVTINGCSSTVTGPATLSDPPSPAIDSVAYNNPTSCGGTDGSLVIYLSAGSPSGTYGIDVNGGGSDFFVGSAGGTLVVNGLSDGFTVSGLVLEHTASGCTVVDAGATATLSDPTPPSVTVGSMGETCAGNNDGVIGVSPSGGTPAYSSNWYTDNTLSTLVTGSPADTIFGVASGWYFVEVTDAVNCTGSDSVFVSPGAVVPVTTNVTAIDSCINSNSFDFDGTVPGSSSQSWEFSGGTPATASTAIVTGVQFSNSGPNLVVNVVFDAAGCEGRDSIYVTVYDTAAPTVTPMDPSCFGMTDGSISANIVGGQAPYSSDLSGLGAMAGATPTWSSLGAGSYILTVTDNHGCVSTAFGGLANPAAVSFDTIVTNATCGLSNGAVAAVNPTGGVPPYTFSFDGSPFTTTTVYNGLASSTYQLIMNDDNGCADTIDVTINTVGTLPNTPVLASGYTFCDPAPFGGITATGTSGVGNFDWYIDDTTGAPIQTTGTGSVTFASLPSGPHTLYVIHTLTLTGCSSYAGSATFEYWPNDHTISPEFSVCPNGGVQFDGTVTTGTFLWDNTSGELSDQFTPIPIATPTGDSTTYTYVYQNSASCTYPGSVLVVYDTTDCNALADEITNAFSPDGDGVNDGWFIDGINNHPDNRVMVFNRWGDVIVEFSGYNNADIIWEGKNQSGDELPAGTYFYVIELMDSGTSRTGWVQLTK